MGKFQLPPLNQAIVVKLYQPYTQIPVMFAYLISKSRLLRRITTFSLLRLINTLMYTYLLTGFL